MTKRNHTENTVEPLVRTSKRAPLGGGGLSNALMSTGTQQQGANKAAASSTLTPPPASASATTSKFQEQHQKQLAPGLRCAVYYDNITDFLGATNVGGWYLGTIVTVQHSQKTCKVRYDDKSEIAILPFKDVLPLRKGTTTKDAHLWYSQSEDGQERVMADEKPKNVKVGDLVLAKFQNGKFDRNNDAWFRGRVAKVDQNDDGRPICEVAYEDKDYESGIPLDNDVVTLLERGWENPAWLEGLTVHIPSKNFAKECVTGVIEATKPNQPVSIRYTKKDGTTVVEKHPFKRVVQTLYEKAKEDPSVLFYEFKFVQFGVSFNEVDSHPESPAKKQKRSGPKKAAAAAPARKNRGQARKTTHETATAAMEIDHEDFSGGVEEDKKPAARKTTSRTRKAAAAAKKPAASMGLEDDHDVEAVAETLCRLELDPPLPDPERPLRTVDQSLAQHFGDALTSCNAEQGYEWLSFLSSKHNRVPNDKLWWTLLDLNAWGPKSNGRTIYPDSYKMTLCNDYLLQIFAKKDMLQACSALIDNQFKSGHGGLSYADTFFQQMMGEYYLAENDETRYTTPAAERIVETLHAKACFAEIFSRLLQHNLKPFVVADSNSQRKVKDESYKTVPIVRDIVQARRGSKDALEQSVRAFAQLYLKWGPFLLDDGLQPYLDNNVTRKTLNLANDEVHRLLELLGTVASYLAWLYSKEANENVDALADIIGNVVRIAIEEDTFDKEPLLGGTTMEKFVVKMKLRLILSVKMEIVPQLRPKLAERLHVAKIYNVFYGDNSYSEE